MRRLSSILATLILALVALTPTAAQPARTLLDPSQVDPALTRAISTFVPPLGYAHAGDCGLAAPDQGQLCSQVWQDLAGNLTVVLIDAANIRQFVLAALLQPNGTWALSGSDAPPSAGNQAWLRSFACEA